MINKFLYWLSIIFFLAAVFLYASAFYEPLGEIIGGYMGENAKGILTGILFVSAVLLWAGSIDFKKEKKEGYDKSDVSSP